MNSLTFKICCNYNSDTLKRFIDSLLECHIDFNIRTYWKNDVKRMVDYYLVTIYDARKFIGSGKSGTEVYYDPDIFTEDKTGCIFVEGGER